jgi:hypothetical protein
MRSFATAGVLLWTACTAPATEVPDAGTFDPLSCPPTQGLNGWAAFAGVLGDVDRPDEAKRYLGTQTVTDGGAVEVSGALVGGRLILTFTSPPVSGPLPTTNPDAMCDPPQSLFFFRPTTGDAGGGGGEWTTGMLTVSDGGLDADGGQRTSLVVSEIVPVSGLSGPLPDRSFDLVLP